MSALGLSMYTPGTLICFDTRQAQPSPVSTHAPPFVGLPHWRPGAVPRDEGGEALVEVELHQWLPGEEAGPLPRYLVLRAAVQRREADASCPDN